MRHRALTTAALLAASLTFTGSALADPSAYLQATDGPAAADIAGLPGVQLSAVTDQAAFRQLDPTPGALAFSCPLAAPGDPCYQRITFGPLVSQQLLAAPLAVSLRSGHGALALFTLVHEAYHLRLHSTDEGLVNACALRDFGLWLSHDFGVSATHRVRARVPHHRHRWHWVTRWSPLYGLLLADATAIYRSMPAPYSTGTCTAPAVTP
jgi:hypothetical protein